MARVHCEIETGYVYNDEGREVEGVIATCSKCGHTTESLGTSDGSKKRCLALMNDECPMEEDNFYETTSLD